MEKGKYTQPNTTYTVLQLYNSLKNIPDHKKLMNNGKYKNSNNKICKRNNLIMRKVSKGWMVGWGVQTSHQTKEYSKNEMPSANEEHYKEQGTDATKVCKQKKTMA